MRVKALSRKNTVSSLHICDCTCRVSEGYKRSSLLTKKSELDAKSFVSFYPECFTSFGKKPSGQQTFGGQAIDQLSVNENCQLNDKIIFV
jgi:hypothetical protein